MKKSKTIIISFYCACCLLLCNFYQKDSRVKKQKKKNTAGKKEVDRSTRGYSLDSKNSIQQLLPTSCRGSAVPQKEFYVCTDISFHVKIRQQIFRLFRYLNAKTVLVDNNVFLKWMHYRLRHVVRIASKMMH